MQIIGIDLGGTKVAGALFKEDGTIVKKQVRLLSGQTGKAVGQLILSLVHDLVSGAASKEGTVGAVGVCVPGIVCPQTERVWAPNIPGWEDYPLKSELEAFLQEPSWKISLESDRTCYILGEVWKGAAAGCRDAVFLSVGTGIGAGILTGGRVLHGANDIAGATGWMALQSPFVAEYRSCGCFEYYASGAGILAHARRLLATTPDYTGFLKNRMPQELTTLDVFEAFEKNDAVAVQVIDKAVEMWGMATANLVSLLNPEKIIFGGGVFGPAVQLLEAIRQEARKWAQPVSMQRVKLEASQLKGDAGIFGAAFSALQPER